MDVNGTRFHLLLGRDDFGRRCSAPGVGGTTASLEDVFKASADGADASFSWNAQTEEMTLVTTDRLSLDYPHVEARS